MRPNVKMYRSVFQTLSEQSERGLGTVVTQMLSRTLCQTIASRMPSLYRPRHATKAVCPKPRMRKNERIVRTFEQFSRGLGSNDGTAEHSLSGVRTVRTLCERWTKWLERSCVPEPRVSVEYIVAHVLGKKTLYKVDRGLELNEEQVETVNSLCQQRMNHKPIQYIVGEWDFGDLELKMKAPVFIPRPETEELVGLAAMSVEERGLQSGHLLELCCGSGAVILSLLHRFPSMRGVAVDILPQACSLTSENASRLGMSHRLTVVQGDLSDEAVQKKLREFSPFDMLVSNPPYIPSGEMSALEPQILQFEDHRALHGGEDGLDVVEHILLLSPQLLKPNSDILMEIHPGQGIMIKNMVTTAQCHCRLQFVSSRQDYLGRCDPLTSSTICSRKQKPPFSPP